MNNIAAQGRYGDNAVAHVNKSELMIPPELQTPEVMAAFQQAAMQAGVDPMQFIAGAPQNSVNPATGMPEYGLGPGGAGSSGGQANDGGAGPGGMGAGNGGDMGTGAANNAPNPVGAYFANDPMVKALKANNVPAGIAFGLAHAMPGYSVMKGISALGQALGAETAPDGSMQDTYSGQKKGGHSLASRMLA